MNSRQKIALVAVVLNSAFAVLKFAIYRFSGSLAVLAEAWHSLSDILTSLMVFLSLKDRLIAPASPAETVSSGIPVVRLWKRTPAEQRVSFLIGLFITSAALGVIHKAVFGPAAVVFFPALNGFFFLLFALGSFMLSHYELKQGRDLNSPGLISDSLHSRADMAGALITGFSLLIVQIGLNVDRLAALIVSLLMLHCALEILVNLRRARKGQGDWQEGAAARALADGWQGAAARKLRERLGRAARLAGLPPPQRARIRRAAALAAALAVLIALLRLCLYAVGPAQEAARERWGRPLNWGRPIGPGLHWKYPWEKAVRVDSRSIRSRAVGNVTSAASAAYLWTVDHGMEEPFISGDNNFFYPYLVVHYRVRDIFPYLYRHRSPETLLDDLATATLTRIFSRREFYDIAITSRRAVEDDLRRETQRSLDALDSGLEICSVSFRDIHPPLSIATAYETVIAAWQEKERMINEAAGYRNRSLPEARGREATSLASAAADSVRKRDAAAGESEGFLRRREAYGSNPQIISRRLLYQALSEGLKDRRIVIVDPAAGTPDLWSRIATPAALPPDVRPAGVPGEPSPESAPWKDGTPEEDYFRSLRDKL